MPIYNYRCEECEKEYEAIVFSATAEPDPCPSCKSTNVHKALTAHGGYHIKGNNGASERPRRAGSFKK